MCPWVHLELQMLPLFVCVALSVCAIRLWQQAGGKNIKKIEEKEEEKVKASLWLLHVTAVLLLWSRWRPL